MIIQDSRFGDNLLRLRKISGLSQYKLVAKMQLLGSNMSRSTYAKIEAGDRNIKITDLVILQKIYKVDYAEFFEGVEVEE
ncbi:Helix-turn-helix domain-containing protein [Anaerocolumna jejuensis DSM 15929]|uniref:Helix-turn-helix domain-containing protein n=1 Tax=Anaerocolumna jejuensis DSM 15929 TaxID=1121322 RepID=A0A1M6ZBT7_9FIRM|nr:helix-turn-helix transcriptional regulator [Anaerocolumna jejuensis]SHL27938.1 Helix-turn-helix domain-containing protein [Anaerocolumna jejuensis DSM 15929]